MNLPPARARYDAEDESRVRDALRVEFDRLAADLPFRVLTASVTWNPASTADGAVAAKAVDVPGARVGDPVSVGFSANAAAKDALWTGYVDQADRVRVTMLNKTGAALDLGSGTLTVMVFQPR